MTEEELAQLSDEELITLGKKMKSASIIYALGIGFLFGIILFSVINKSITVFTLIPIYFIYKATKDSKQNKLLKTELKKRNIEV